MKRELEAAKRETSLISAMASSVENDLSLTRQELSVYQTNVDQVSGMFSGQLLLLKFLIVCPDTSESGSR